MPAKLFYVAGSPPARSVLLTLKTLNIPFELKEVDLRSGEHRSPEFLKMNPQHTIPTFVDDDGFVVIDSHAINAYLVTKYAKDDQLYPKDVKAKSVVDHRLHFDNGVLYQVPKFVFKSFMTKAISGMTPEIAAMFEDAYGSLEKFLSATGPYIAGKQVTIADFSIITTLASANVFFPVNKEKFPLLVAYSELCRSKIPFCAEINDAGIAAFQPTLKDFKQLPSQ